MKRRVVIPVLLAVSIIVSLGAGPFGTIGFLLRSPIILMNDLISIVRQAFAPLVPVGANQPQTDTTGVGLTGGPISTSGLAASLHVTGPSTTSEPSPPPPSSTPAPPSEVLVPPPDEALDPVEEVLSPAEPVLDPVQDAADPVVNSVENALEPVTDSTESAVGSVADPVEKALEPVKDTIGGSDGGNTPDVGGAVQDLKNAVDKIGAP